MTFTNVYAYSTSTFYSSTGNATTSDGFMFGNPQGDISTAHNLGTSTTINTNNNYFTVYSVNSGGYTLQRSFIGFDISPIIGKYIVSAKMVLTPAYSPTTSHTSSLVVIPLYDSNVPLTYSDYGNFTFGGGMSELTTPVDISTLASGTAKDLIFNSVGVSYFGTGVIASKYLRFGLTTTADTQLESIANTTGSGVSMYSAETVASNEGIDCL